MEHLVAHTFHFQTPPIHKVWGPSLVLLLTRWLFNVRTEKNKRQLASLVLDLQHNLQ